MNYIDRKGFASGSADDYGYGVSAGIGFKYKFWTRWWRS